MDIELSLRELLVLENPGPRFTDGVMSRVGDVPAGLPRNDVVQLADARLRKRSRRILVGTLLVVMAAAASVVSLVQRGQGSTPVVQDAVAALAGSAAHADPALTAPVVEQQFPATGDDKDPQACVDPDVLRGLLLPAPNASYSIGDLLPPELAAFKAPRQLEWVGSSERSLRTAQSTVAAVYRSSLTPEAAKTAAVGALAAGGWKLQPSSIYAMNVFMSSTMPGAGDTYCREGKPVSITSSALDSGTYVVLSIDRNAGGTGGRIGPCDAPLQLAQPGAELDRYMPKLELPRDPATGQPVAMQGSSGGSGDVKRQMSTSFSLQDTVGNVASHFARQMAAQGWSAETSWSGTGTAGSTWNRAVDRETFLHGSLMVSALDGGRFTVVFQVVRPK